MKNIESFESFVNEASKKEERDYIISDDNIQYSIKNIGKHYQADEREKMGEAANKILLDAVKKLAKLGFAKPRKVTIEL